MECFIRIGDCTLTVVQAHHPDNILAHIVTVQDTFKLEGGLEVKQVQLASEVEACELVRDFMQPEPFYTGPFNKHFPEFMP
jgi:hypothetical protein